MTHSQGKRREKRRGRDTAPWVQLAGVVGSCWIHGEPSGQQRVLRAEYSGVMLKGFLSPLPTSLVASRVGD